MVVPLFNPQPEAQAPAGRRVHDACASGYGLNDRYQKETTLHNSLK
jgi:hypothetical protein